MNPVIRWFVDLFTEKRRLRQENKELKERLDQKQEQINRVNRYYKGKIANIKRRQNRS